MSGKKRVLQNSVIYTFSNMLLKTFSFFLLPLYTSYLTTKDYGITGLVGSFTSVAGYIIAFSLFSAVVKFYTEFQDDPVKVKRLFGTLFIFVFLSGCVFSFLFFLLKNVLMNVFFRGIDYFPTIFIALLGLTFNGSYTIYTSILQALQRAKKFAITSIAFFFAQLLLNILFVVVIKMGANGVLLASAITYASFMIYAILDLRAAGIIIFCIDSRILITTLKYSIPIIPHNLASTIAQLISKIFLNTNFKLSSVGLFNLGTQFGAIADMIQSSVYSAFMPWLYRQLKENNESRGNQIVSLSNCLLFVYGICFLGLSFFSQELILIFSNINYYKAWTVVPLIVISYVIKTPYYFYIGVLFYYVDLSKKIFWATCSSALVNIALSAILIPRLDMYGSVLADILAMILRVTIIVILSKKRVTFEYKFKDFLIFTVGTIIFIGIGLIPSFLYFPYSLSMINFGYKVFIIMIYCGIYYLYFKKDLKPAFILIKNKILKKNA